MEEDNTTARVNRWRSLRRSPSGRSSRSWSPPLLRPCDGRRSRYRSRSGAREEEEEEKTASAVYLSVSYARGPVSQSVFALNMSQLDGADAIIDNQVNRTGISIFPIIEFSADKFPTDMSCVTLKSNLYFIGGCVHGSPCCHTYPRDVYFIDLSFVSPFPNVSGTDASVLLSNGVIRKAAPMHFGKPDIYTFVANEKIYVISSEIYPTETVRFHPKRKPRFEVYDPEEDTWSVILPQPPFCCPVRSSAPFGRKILFETMEGSYYFDLDHCSWTSLASLSCLHNIAPQFHAMWVADRLYWNRITCNVISFQSSTEIETEVNGTTLNKFFDGRGVCSPHLRDTISSSMPAELNFTQLLHLGNSIFCYVLSGTDAPNCPDNFGNFGVMSDSRIIVFRVPREVGDSSSTYMGEDEQHFTPEVLHVTRLMCRSNSGADPTFSVVDACCSNYDFLNCVNSSD